jgi:hypothetical protein
MDATDNNQEVGSSGAAMSGDAAKRKAVKALLRS